MHKNNKGFSTIELIAVIAILAILTAGTLVIFHQIGYANTMKAAKLIDSELSKVRIETMSREEKQYLYLYNIDGTVYRKASTKANPSEAGLNAASGTAFSKNISLIYKLEGAGETGLNNGANLCISFDRSSGNFDTSYEFIRLVSANHSSTIAFTKETGRHEIE